MANCGTCGLKKYCIEQGKTMGSSIDCSFYQFDEKMGSDWAIKDTQKTENFKIDETKPKIASIDKEPTIYIYIDNVIYVLGKVADAIDDTLNDRTKNVYNEDGDLVGRTTKNYLEMFETLGEKIQDIVNEMIEKKE